MYYVTTLLANRVGIRSALYRPVFTLHAWHRILTPNRFGRNHRLQVPAVTMGPERQRQGELRAAPEERTWMIMTFVAS